MCTCIPDIEKKLTNQFHDGRKIIKAEFDDQGLTFEKKDTKVNVNIRSYSTFTCEVEGRKRSVPYKVFHSYCPFCGKKINAENKKSDQKT